MVGNHSLYYLPVEVFRYKHSHMENGFMMPLVLKGTQNLLLQL